MADEEKAPSPSWQDKGKAKVGEPASDFTAGEFDDDQSEINEPPWNTAELKDDETEPVHYKPERSVPRSLPKEAMCLILTLNAQEVAEANPKLYLTADEAYLLTYRAETVANPPGMFSMDLDVYDTLDQRYHMKLSNHHTGSLKRFLVNSEWSRFVFFNKLKEGDELWFFRLVDPDSGQPCYALRHFKHPGNVMPSSTRNLPSPEPSVAPRVVPPRLKEEDSVLSKTLNSLNMDPTNSMLYIDDSEAYTLTDCVDLLNPASIPSPMTLSVFDEVDRPYKMLLSYCTVNGYTISQDWGKFVRIHKLKAGDRILFYRFPTGHVLDPYYELNYIRKEESEMSRLLERPDLKRNPGPGSRGIENPAIKLTKTLSAHQGNQKLWFDSNEAWLLTGSSRIFENCALGTILMSLLVYDEEDRSYDMVLTKLKRADGEETYTLDGGWQRFVDSYGLGAGDKVTIYRIQDELRYVLRYTKAGLPSSSGASAARPSGSG